MNKYILILAYFVLSGFVGALDISLDFGYSNYSFTENSPNNKVDNYSIDSGLVGISVTQDISSLSAYIKVWYQVPFDISFKDALGSDPSNLLTSHQTFFYGLKTNLGVGREIVLGKFIFFPSLFMTHDFFYIKRFGYTDFKDEFIFSTIGTGLSLDIHFQILKSFSIGIGAGGSYNYLNTTELTGDFLWSYGYVFKGFFSLFL